MTLERLFLTVLEISVASIPVIILLLLISPLLGKRYAPGLRCLLWLALAVRLVLPFNMPWQHAFHIDLFPAIQPQTGQTGWFLPNPAPALENESRPESEKQMTMPEQEARRKSVRIAPAALLAAAWAAGTALFLLYHMGAYIHTLRRLRRWSKPVDDDEILDRFASVKRELSVRGKVGLYRSSKAACPLLAGFIRPCVILPESPLTTEQLDFMLRHELWHLKRGDLWRKLAILLANAVHWFNPLVWLVDRRANLDSELACDADVLREADSGTRKEYGYAVLSFIEQGWRCKTPLTSGFYGGKKQMKQRFFNIADTSAKKRGTAIFCAAALIIALAGCAVNATGSVGQDNSEPAQTPILSPYEVTRESNGSIFVTRADNGEAESSVQEHSQEITKDILEIMEWSKDPYTGGEMAWPFPDNTRIIQPYGENPQIPDNYHTGLDISGEQGDKIIAANDGKVIKVNRDSTPGVGYGMYVIIDHGGEISTLYAHCSKILVEEGESVVKGRYIAEAGATGFAQEPHLHFEVRETAKTVDPMPYITSNGFVWPTNGGGVVCGLSSYPGHTGIDIAGGVPEGSPVYAAAAGTVAKAIDNYTGYGKHIIIDHGNGFQTLYAHNSELYVSEGDVVAKGQTIAAVGRSGSAYGFQLHFEVRQDGKILDPEDFVTAPDSEAARRYSEIVQPENSEYTAQVDGDGLTYTVDISGDKIIFNRTE